MSIVISVENLSKTYRLGQIGTGTFANDLKVWWAKTRGKPNPLLKIGEADYGNRDGEDVWALKDVSFTVEQGEVLGIIGRNGAGKSTLLKILSRITAPTSGAIKVKGRVASLLEVGTGFHPELTGRENIYLNGAILGMKRDEITHKFDEIVDFAEVEKFIDTPVKRYSSGMYVRLAFAVAAHLDPEILVVDEVLAVGDAEFQKKCLGKMGDVAKQGRTILFVSHNMGMISRLCMRGIILRYGNLESYGLIDEVVHQYTNNILQTGAEVSYPYDESKTIQVQKISLLDHTGFPSTRLDRMYPFKVVIQYEVRQRIVGAHVGVMLDKSDKTPVCHTADIDEVPGNPINREKGVYKTEVEFPGRILNAGAYQIRIAIARYGGNLYDYQEPFMFELIDNGTFASTGSGGKQRPGILALPLNWLTEQVTQSTL